jgi:hypothetical protein
MGKNLQTKFGIMYKKWGWKLGKPGDKNGGIYSPDRNSVAG